MLITYDPAKNARNLVERGLSFERVAELDWDTARLDEDLRRDYGERRIRVLALLGGRLHTAIITPRGEATHVISFRKAHWKEIRDYERARAGGGSLPS
jgi:uncharacterized DUF497 family protein